MTQSIFTQAGKPPQGPGKGSGAPPKPGAPPAAPGPQGSAFRRAAEQVSSLRPDRVITLPVSAWNADYPGAAREDVKVGLRRWSEAEAVQARAAAAGAAWRLHPQESDGEERVVAGNGALMAWLVAGCTTKPGDRRVRFFGSPQAGGAEDAVPLALTSGGLEYLFGELESMVAAESPTAPEADDEDVAWLVASLQEGALDKLGALEAKRVRRMLAGAISWMRDGDGEEG